MLIFCLHNNCFFKSKQTLNHMGKKVYLLLMLISTVLIFSYCKKPMMPIEYVGYFNGSYVDEIGVEHQNREQWSLLLTEFDEDHICFKILSLKNTSDGYVLVRKGNHFEGCLGSYSVFDYGTHGYATFGSHDIMGKITETGEGICFGGEYTFNRNYHIDDFHEIKYHETGTFEFLPK